MSIDRELADEIEFGSNWRFILTLEQRQQILAALRRSQPEGEMMVPREPTMAMKRAGAEWIDIRAANESPYTTDRIVRAGDTYRAMLSEASKDAKQ